MNRKLKTLVSAAVAALAVMALSASAAQAASFHSEVSHTVLQGTQIGEPVFTVNAGTVRCTGATTEDTGEALTETTVRGGNATFTGCTAFGFVNATADLNGCEIEASADTEEVNVVNCITAATFTAFNCWITIGNQNGLKTVTYSNVGAGKSRYLKGTANITGIKYTQDSKSFPGCANGTFTNGTLKGEGEIKGFNTAGEQVGIWKE